MESILVSACLLGEAVRYDGGHKRCDSPILLRWLQEGRIVAVCPEVAGGLPVPRHPAEIAFGAGGIKVLENNASVVDDSGWDVTKQFVQGAQYALRIARSKMIRIAILKEGSPSCGSQYTYDGSFTSTRVAQPGVSTALLQQAGIHVFNERQLEEADELLKSFESGETPSSC